jgi:hypothetical protein
MLTATNTTDLGIGALASILGHDNLGTSPDEGQSKARIAPVLFDDGHPVYDIIRERTGGDIYDLIEATVAEDSVNYYAVITAGWAAPTDSLDGSVPSKHPERRRVQLLCVVGRDGSAGSALKFGDEKELIIDEGQATGSLADALASIFA